jgi:chromosome segregation ATPase
MQANDAANATCDKLRDQIADAVDAKQAVEAQNAPLHEEAAALRKELEESEEALREERSQGCAREMEIERLSRECATLDVEGRKLRDDWDDKVSMLTAAEQERDYWHTALHALAGQYSDGFARLEAMNVNPNHFAMRRSPIQQGDWAVSSGSASPRPAFSPTTATASISPAPRIHGW